MNILYLTIIIFFTAVVFILLGAYLGIKYIMFKIEKRVWKCNKGYFGSDTYFHYKDKELEYIVTGAQYKGEN
jgi:hypothetical protein